MSARRTVASRERPIAYICAEYAIDDLLPLYAGGLGILAGDILREAGEMGVPFVAIGLLYQKGFLSYPRRDKEDGIINPERSGFTRVKNTEGSPLVVGILVGDHEVYFQTWTQSWGSASIYLLDPCIAENIQESDRDITNYLYPEDFDQRVRQEIILGVGGVALLQALNISPSVYHLNEGHTSFAALALALQEIATSPEKKTYTQALEIMKPMIVGTKHTILPGAGIFFTKEQCSTYLGKLLQVHGVSEEEFFSLGLQGDNTELFSTTQFLLRSSIRASAVSRLHAEFEKKECPTCQELIPVTNGISATRWMRTALVPDMTDETLWQEHMAAKQDLVRDLQNTYGVAINPESMIIVWARRIAEYKRPLLLFEDMKRLARIVGNMKQPVTILISGNAYGWDTIATKLLETLLQTIKDLNQPSVMYLPRYSMGLSRSLVSGADVWLNTPQFGKEASGTSGMKSAINGALQLSVADGWFGEVKDEDCLWTLDPSQSAESLYDVLEREVIPTFYKRDDAGYPKEWISKMRKTRGIILEHYTARRMLEEYIAKLYFPPENT